MVSNLYEALPCMFELLAFWQPFLWSVQLLQGCFNRSHPLFTLQHRNKSEPLHNFIMPFWNMLDNALMKNGNFFTHNFFSNNLQDLILKVDCLVTTTFLLRVKNVITFSNGIVFWVEFDSLHNKKCKWSLCDAANSNASHLCHQGLFWYDAIISVGDIIL